MEKNESKYIYIANPESGAPHKISFEKYKSLYCGDTAYFCWGIE
jgi:hypothetical protein